MAEAHQLDRQLLADKITAESQSQGSTLLGLVVEQLRRQEPRVKQVSPKQYRELADQLKRGYTKQQLLHFITSSGLNVSRSSRKQVLVQKILDDLWKIDKCLEDAPAGSAFVEKTIPLSDRSLFLLLSGNGSLIRTWTKSGARVWLLQEKRELLVRASAETYDWIVASLHNMEENLVVGQTSLRHLRGATPLDWNTLNTIQRLSEAFFVLEDGLESDELVLYARDKRSIELALQLLVNMVPLPKWTSKSVLYDVSPENLPRCQFAAFGDAGSLVWNERFNHWSRWEKVKSREPFELGASNLQSLQKVSFKDIDQPDVKTPEDAIVGNLQSKLSGVDSAGAVTITATLGFLLHQPRDNTVLPNVAMPKTFSTNIPLVSKVVGELPLNDADVLAEDSEATVADAIEPESKEQDLWDLILGAKENESKAFTSKRKDLANEVSRMLQIKLIPNPFKDGGLQEAYPPVEIWAEIGHKGLQVDNAKVVTVPHEHDVLVSLPNKLSDLKFSVTSTNDVALTPALERFLQVSFVSPEEVKYVPSTVEIEVDGQAVEYRLHSVNQRLQIDLNYKGSMVQFSMVDGGKLGGRKVDATLVYHEEAGKQHVDVEELHKLVSRSTRLIEEFDEAQSQVGPSLVFNL